MDNARKRFRQHLFGWILAFAGLIFAQGLGIAFGAVEDDIKAGLAESAAEVIDTVYEGDQAKADKVVSKSWVYYKRAHLHGNAMATTALVLLLLLGFVQGPKIARQLVAFGLGFGSLGYGLFWMWAGCRAPGLGSTGAAKESLAWLALPSSSLFVLATVATGVLFVMTALKGAPSEAD